MADHEHDYDHDHEHDYDHDHEHDHAEHDAAGPADEQAVHEAIARLADDLVPALMAKLGATGLGEIEIRKGDWKVRVRRPPGEPAGQVRRSSEGPSRAQPGHAGHGHGPAGFEGHRSARDARSGAVPAGTTTVAAAGADATNGASPNPGGAGTARSEARERRAVATSPAVGVYQPRSDVRAGTRVRAGDRIGAVDMLGVAQEVVAPADGVIGASLVEPGQAVEYGQEIVVIELVVPPSTEA